MLTAGVPPWFNLASAQSVLLVLGDSLSAGYGVPAGKGWVDLLARRVADARPGWTVVNASISGETTFGGLDRLPALLDRHAPAVVAIELGANDGLRGTDLALTRDNLVAIVQKSRAAGARTLVIGMRIPPNYGPRYTERFFGLFGEVARGTGSGYVPFLLDGFAERRELFQDDGIHPAAAAQGMILDNVWPALEAEMDAARGRKLPRKRGS